MKKIKVKEKSQTEEVKVRVRKRFNRSCLLILVLFLVCWGLIAWNTTRWAVLFHREPVESPLPLIDYSQYSCPPVLTTEECHRRIDLCIANGFDVEEYLLAVYNRLKK